MPLYRFTIHESARAPAVRTATLPDDNSAWDYGETIIRALLQGGGNVEESRSMVIAQGGRIVASIAFNLAEIKRSLQ